jgi:hypothetical protein
MSRTSAAGSERRPHVSGNVDYRLLDRFVEAQRENTDSRYDVQALDRLRTVIELRREDRRHGRPQRASSVVPLPLDD